MSLAKIKSNQHPWFRPFGHMFDEFFGEMEQQGPRFVPSANIVETEKAFELELSLPGLKKEDIKINVEKNHLVISGEKERKAQEEGVKFHRIELSYGKFSRRFFLPESVDRDKISASFEDGILKMELPKLEKEQLSQNIEIK